MDPHFPANTRSAAVALVAQRLAKLTGDAIKRAIVVEVAYIDPRDEEESDRRLHVDDAIQLLSSFQQPTSIAHNNLFVTAFLNDLPRARVCGIEQCLPLSRTGGQEISAEQPHEISVRSLRVPAFYMRNTRNRATKTLARAMRRNAPPRFMEQSSSNTFQLFVETIAGPVLLGSRESRVGRITPRCTLIMAQHYFDLGMFAMESQQVEEIIIIDFNRAAERDRVRLGAEASFEIHPWPEKLGIRILNVVYYPDPFSPGVQLTERLRDS